MNGSKEYLPRYGTISSWSLLGHNVVFVIMPLGFSIIGGMGMRESLVFIAIVLALFNVFTVMYTRMMKRRFTVRITKSEVSGPSPRLGRRISIDRQDIDPARCGQLLTLDKWLRRYHIVSKDGKRIAVSAGNFHKADIRNIWMDLGLPWNEPWEILEKRIADN